MVIPLLTSIVAGISLSPLISLIAGILILIMPRLLNFIVAIYLIIIVPHYHWLGRRIPPVDAVALQGEVLQLCSHPVVGWKDAASGIFGLWAIQVATI